MPRLINSPGTLPQSLDFQPVLRAIDTTQSLQTFNSNNSTSVSASAPSTLSIRMNSTKWYNAKSSYFMFNATNLHTETGETGTFKNGISSLFKSLTVLNNGVVIEQIREYGVLSRLMQITQVSPAATSNWDIGYEPVAERPTTAVNGTVTTARSYTMQPLAGFLSSDYLIPLWSLGEIEIRLELNSANEGIINPDITNTLAGADFTISNFKYIVETHDLPASYNRKVQDHINAVGLSYSLQSFDTVTFNANTGTTQDTTISNNAKSVKSVFVALRPATNLNNTIQEYNFIKDTLDTAQLRIGGLHYPQEEMDTRAQAWKELIKSVAREGHLSSHFDITSDQYAGVFNPTAEKGNTFLIGWDTEKFAGGDLISGTDFSEHDIVLRHSYTGAPTDANRYYVFIYKDVLLTIVPNFNVVVSS